MTASNLLQLSNTNNNPAGAENSQQMLQNYQKSVSQVRSSLLTNSKDAVQGTVGGGGPPGANVVAKSRNPATQISLS